MNRGRIGKWDRACLVLCVVAAIAVSAWSVADVVARKGRIARENAALTGELRDLEAMEARLRTFRQEAIRVRGELAGLDSAIPPAGGLGVLLQQLERRMKQRRLVLESVEPQEGLREARVVKTPIRLVCQGTFLATYQFLHDLEGMDRLLIPGKLVLTGGDQPGRCRADLTVWMFERPAAAQAGG